MTEPNARTTEPLTAFADALVGISGQLASIVSHMLDNENPNARESVPEVLRRLFTDIFRAELAADDTSLRAAATVLEGAAAAIEENLFLVPPVQPRRRGRRKRGH